MRFAIALCAAAVVAGLPSLGAQSTAPLPDQSAFLAEARKRLASNDLLQSRYTYRERVTNVRMNPFGRMGTGPIEIHQVYAIAGTELEYHRVLERDGVPVPRAELTLKDRQFLAQYEEWRRAASREGHSEREARLKREAAAREKDREQAREAVDLFTFTLERRDLLEGQPAIVIRFAPKPNARPRTREGRLASSFSGYVWIHEHEHEVMRVEAEAVEDTVFGFGVIGRLYKGAKALFTRRKFGDVWLPVETRVTGTARAMLFRKVAINYLREYSDYRPFDPSELPALLGGATSNK